MQQALMFGPFVIKIALFILVISIVAGLVFFHIMIPFSKEKTKKYLENMETFLFVLIFSIWGGKTAIQAQTFIHDPIATLAHPSNSEAFYIGLIATVIYSKWKIVKNEQHLWDLLLAILYLFFASYFVYELASMWIDDRQTIFSFIFIIFFFIFFILMQNRISNETLVTITVSGIGWSQWVISLFNPTFVYQYAVHSWFWFVISLFGLYLYFLLLRKRRSQ